MFNQRPFQKTNKIAYFIITDAKQYAVLILKSSIFSKKILNLVLIEHKALTVCFTLPGYKLQQLHTKSGLIMHLRDSLPQIVNKLLYICLLALGIYWVCIGDAFNKYLTEKTGFAESAEPSSELPTILFQFEETGSLPKYGEDFKLSYSVRYIIYKKQIPVNLTLGENIIPGPGINLKILLEEIRTSPWLKDLYYKITPQNFSSGTPVSYNLQCKNLLHSKLKYS